MIILILRHLYHQRKVKIYKKSRVGLIGSRVGNGFVELRNIKPR